MRTVEHIEDSISRLRHLQEQIETARQNFLPREDHGTRIPAEVTTFHLQKELVALGREVKSSVRSAFGEQSKQYRGLIDVRSHESRSPGFQEYLAVLDRLIFDLHQERLHCLQDTDSPPLPGIDPMTDLYTERMLVRYLEHELAWAQRCGTHFGVIYIRIQNWPSAKRKYAVRTVNEIIVSMACVFKTYLRAHDYAARVNDCEFAAIAREVNSVSINGVVQHLVVNFQLLAHPVLPGTIFPIEYTTVIYPFDGETVKALLSKAARNWSLYAHR
jgi:diguanylate cyclase (GGDEF)-like protein